MARIASQMGFEGWLINIENKVAPEHVVFLELFVEELTLQCKKMVSKSDHFIPRIRMPA